MRFHHSPFYAARCGGCLVCICLVIGVAMLSRRISASGFTRNDADTIFDSYSNAFYSLDGTNGYFKDVQTGGVADFWKQAEEIECVIDAYEWTSNVTYKVMFTRLLNGFARDNTTNWSANIYNDDCLWACIAFARGWDAVLGGGLYWTTGNRSKNACDNGPGGIAACLLGEIYGDAGYLT